MWRKRLSKCYTLSQLLSGINTQVMQKLGFTPRGLPSFRHCLLPHQRLEQKNNFFLHYITHLLTVFTFTLHTILSHTPRVRTTASHSKTQQHSWQTEGSTSREYSYTRARIVKNSKGNRSNRVSVSAEGNKQEKQTREKNNMHFK